MSAEHQVSSASIPHPPVCLDLVRDFAREAGLTQPVSEEDARAVLDHFACGDTYRPLPEEGSPEFWAELERRSQSGRAVLSAKTVSEFLHVKWG